MIEKITNMIPIVKSAAAKGAALAVCLVDIMKDLRKYDPAQDPARDYRAAEIRPEIAPLLEKARQRRGAIFIPEKGIDQIIAHQEKDIEETKRYIAWKYLGSMTYKEAFIDPVEDPQQGESAEDLRREVAQLRRELAALTQAVKDLRESILIAD